MKIPRDELYFSFPIMYNEYIRQEKAKLVGKLGRKTEDLAQMAGLPLKGDPAFLLFSYRKNLLKGG